MQILVWHLTAKKPTDLNRWYGVRAICALAQGKDAHAYS